MSGDLFAIQGLLSSGSVLSMLEVDKGIHAAGKGDHIIHRAMLLKDSLQDRPRQPCIQVAQPQVLAGSCIRQHLLRSADQLLRSADQLLKSADQLLRSADQLLRSAHQLVRSAD